LTMVEVERLSVTYRGDNGAIDALRDISLSVPRGGSCAIIGPSGCGKSTLLFVLAGLNRQWSGRVTVDGRPPAAGRKEISLILQDYGLLPWKTVWQNTVLGMKIRGFSAREMQSRGENALRQMGLWELRRLFPAQLSGGQRQRVAIARSLSLEPELLLMDEPFSSLDALTREKLQDAVLEIWDRQSLTMVLVTHNIEEAVFLGRRIVILSPRPGRVVKVVENPLAGDPAARKAPEFHSLATGIREILAGASHKKLFSG